MREVSQIGDDSIQYLPTVWCASTWRISKRFLICLSIRNFVNDPNFAKSYFLNVTIAARPIILKYRLFYFISCRPIVTRCVVKICKRRPSLLFV